MAEKKATRKTTGPAAKKAAKKAGKKAAPRGVDDGEGAERASELIDERIRELADWRGEVLARMRALILEAAPEIAEEVKWRKPSNPAGVPVWSHEGIVCTGETYKGAVKITFANGAALKDPARLFNASLEGNARRAIDIHEGERVDARAFQALVRDAVAYNVGKKRR